MSTRPMALVAAPGEPVTVDYLSKSGSVQTVSGTVLCGRYPHMYLTVDTGYEVVLDIPLERIKRINGQVIL